MGTEILQSRFHRTVAVGDTLLSFGGVNDLNKKTDTVVRVDVKFGTAATYMKVCSFYYNIINYKYRLN